MAFDRSLNVCRSHVIKSAGFILCCWMKCLGLRNGKHYVRFFLDT